MENKVGIIGLGYVGLIQSLGLVELGNKIVAIDSDQERISTLQKGLTPLYEKDIDKKLNKYIGEMEFSSDIKKIKGLKYIFICVGTPMMASGESDLSYIYSVFNEIKDILSKEQIIVIKSTVPVGTCRDIYTRYNLPCSIISNPEFLREGSALSDFMNPDRIICGYLDNDKKGERGMREIYKTFTKRNIPFIETNLETSELTKYSANAFLGMKISFINNISEVAYKKGADITVISKMLGYDPRIGKDFLRSGIGFGGSCFPKDIKSLIHQLDSLNIDASIFSSILEINNRRVTIICDKILSTLGGSIKGMELGVLGVAFKFGTDDIRESQSIKLIEELISLGAKIHVYDIIDAALDNFKKAVSTSHSYLQKNIIFDDSLNELLENQIIINTVDNNIINDYLAVTEFTTSKKILFDTQNLIQVEVLKKKKITLIRI